MASLSKRFSLRSTTSWPPLHSLDLLLWEPSGWEQPQELQLPVRALQVQQELPAEEAKSVICAFLTGNFG